MYNELRQELNGYMRRMECRADQDEIAQVLQDRYDVGVAIIRGSAYFDHRSSQEAYRWHQKNLKIFEGLIPRDEYFMYKTIAPDPEPKGGGRRLPFIMGSSYHAYHEQRLGKLRLILGRLLGE